MAGFYAVWHGPEGLTRIARRIHLQARLLPAPPPNAPVLPLRHAAIFRHASRSKPAPKADALMQAALDAGFNFRRIDETGIGIALDETVTRAELAPPRRSCSAATLNDAAPAASRRRWPANPPSAPAAVFTAYHAEHAMLRYLKRLEDRDIALNRRMIPLGSCTMKLNATRRNDPHHLAGLRRHPPLRPRRPDPGLQAPSSTGSPDWLAATTGFAGVSLQPNAGSQGEYAGLLAIRAWQEARGEGARDICLIPAQRPWHQPRQRRHGGLPRRGGRLRPRRQRRHRRSATPRSPSIQTGSRR